MKFSQLDRLAQYRDSERRPDPYLSTFYGRSRFHTRTRRLPPEATETVDRYMRRDHFEDLEGES